MRIKTIVAALAATAAIAAALPAAAGINGRQVHQQKRIAQGVRSGALTPRETLNLERRQGRIAAYEARSRADGPGLTGVERVRLDRMQDRASRAIYRQKHDGQVAP